MSIKDKAQGVVGGAFAERLGGDRPGPLRAVAGAAIAGGVTSVVVYRVLRRTEGDD